MRTPTEQAEIAHHIAGIWERQYRKLGLPDADFGYVLAGACGILAGRTTLDPQQALRVMTGGLTDGLRVRGRQ